ncbi:hypothetical protein [Aporhodopirellula aestuarii]|uniref:Secreted protein n=1 Tax=Aporhodopirellula aestuarii TaxID=2950107 RepID=A0ABT0UA98_9BACT|nr:hypothetical protein [Aporhodopirellula aestuarii]MCM2373313.1 hypothetical protein [Aporhodopirellula aestuarii]
MKFFLSAICLCGVMAILGCGDPQPTNVAKDADAAKIEEYNRLNAEAQDDLATDEEESGADEP